MFLQEMDEEELQEMAEAALEETDGIDYHDDGYIELVLKILGLMCDGQNKTLQVCNSEHLQL